MLRKTILASALLGLLAVGCKEAVPVQKPAAAAPPSIKNETLVELKIPEIKFLEGNKPLDCRLFRLRILDLGAGKKVGIHSHENRPGALSIAGGKGMTVYAYNHQPVDVPYGGSYKSYNDIVHYATNSSETEVLSIMTSDFLDDGSPCDGKTYAQHTPIADRIEAENDPFYANAPQTAEEDEVNHESFRTHLRDLKLPEGKAPLQSRSLRVRKVTLGEGAATGAQDFSNRPTYVMNLQGTTEVKDAKAGTAKTLQAKEAANLTQAGQVEIRNAGSGEATYFLIELWDPNDKEIL